MSKLRSVNTVFWSDPFVENLEVDEKLLYLYLITNEKTNMLGIYEASIKKMSFETGIAKERLETILKGFEGLGKVKYVKNYVILINYMKHQKYNPNMKKAALSIYKELPNELKTIDLNNEEGKPLKAFESLLNHYGMVPKIEDEVEDEKEVEYKLYTQQEFLNDWNEIRSEKLKTPSNLNRIPVFSLNNFNQIAKSYDRSAIQNALRALFGQNEVFTSSMKSNPKHFLEHFETYVQAYNDKDKNVWKKSS